MCDGVRWCAMVAAVVAAVAAAAVPIKPLSSSSSSPSSASRELAPAPMSNVLDQCLPPAAFATTRTCKVRAGWVCVRRSAHSRASRCRGKGNPKKEGAAVRSTDDESMTDPNRNTTDRRRRCKTREKFRHPFLDNIARTIRRRASGAIVPLYEPLVGARGAAPPNCSLSEQHAAKTK